MTRSTSSISLPIRSEKLGVGVVLAVKMRMSVREVSHYKLPRSAEVDNCTGVQEGSGEVKPLQSFLAPSNKNATEKEFIKT